MNSLRAFETLFMLGVTTNLVLYADAEASLHMSSRWSVVSSLNNSLPPCPLTPQPPICRISITHRSMSNSLRYLQEIRHRPRLELNRWLRHLLGLQTWWSDNK